MGGMSTQTITVATRNAAFLVFASRFTDSDLIYSEEFQRTLDAALDAAAPHMLAEPWDDAFEKGRDLGEWEAAPLRPEPKYTNPYRSQL